MLDSVRLMIPYGNSQMKYPYFRYE